MMMGREESMPNRAAEPDLTSQERDDAIMIADIILQGAGEDWIRRNLRYVDLKLLARAAKRYVPAGIPAAAPHPVAASNDQTTRASIRDLPGGVICEPLDEESSGVVEPSDDGEGTKRVGDLGLTRAIDINDDTRR